MGAPKPGDAADWSKRMEKGMDTVVSNAIKGFNTMPPKGGRADLSDAQIRAAVEHMISAK